ncbi:MAG: hypothetical protein ABSF50_11170 [Burkholderiaceae bacterium]|jgi:hypothetical protein
MSSPPAAVEDAVPLPDRLTLIAISALAYVLAVGLHEHLGHATACVALGSHVIELGAFYVSCDDSLLSPWRVRLVALAGPLVSLVMGFVALEIANRLPKSAPTGFYFTWLIGTLGLMACAGYLAFSGVSGVGDFGVDAGGFFHDLGPPWPVRVGLIIVGVLAYRSVMQLSVRRIAPRAAGLGEARIRVARRTALVSYLTGGAVSILIGFLNPHGLEIVLISAAASSLGGSAGLLFMMAYLSRALPSYEPGLYFPRSWAWIAVSVLVTVIYALVLGPTLKP